MPELSFWVPGIPQPQGSTRAFKRGAKIVTTSDNKRLRPWRSTVTAEIQDRLGYIAGFAVEGAVTLFVEFYFPRPKFHFGKHGLLPSAPARHTVKPDLSKLIRAIEDSITDAGVWHDDNAVVTIAAAKHYADIMPPGVHITVTPMAQPAATPGAAVTNGDTSPAGIR